MVRTFLAVSQKFGSLFSSDQHNILSVSATASSSSTPSTVVGPKKRNIKDLASWATSNGIAMHDNLQLKYN